MTQVAANMVNVERVATSVKSNRMRAQPSIDMPSVSQGIDNLSEFLEDQQRTVSAIATAPFPHEHLTKLPRYWERSAASFVRNGTCPSTCTDKVPAPHRICCNGCKDSTYLSSDVESRTCPNIDPCHRKAPASRSASCDAL